MKKLLIVIVSLTLVFCFLDYKYTQNKYKDITYSVEKYMTSGLFNRHKLYSVSTMQLTFSDSNIAVVNVTGLQKKVPHTKVSYKVFLEKRKNGTWKIERIYSSS